jgi:hypothetical protein
MSELKTQVEKIDQECKSIRKSLEKSIQKTHDELLEEIRLNNEALKKDLTLNLKEKITAEVGSELRQGIANLKQDLKDDIFQELGMNLQQGLVNLKREITEDLKQNLTVITQNQEEQHIELLNLIKNQNHHQSESSTSNLPPLFHDSIPNPQPTSQYQPLMLYPPKAKIELPKYNRGDNQCVAWFNKTEEYFHIYNVTTDEEKVKYASMYLEGTAYNWYLWWKGRIQSYNWNSFKNDFF